MPTPQDQPTPQPQPLPRKPRRKHPTMADVAEAAGVSVMTVSYAYNHPDRVAAHTRERVLATADEIGYKRPHPTASALRRGAPLQIGIVLGEHLTYAFDDPVASAFLSGVASECVTRGMGMTMIPVTGEEGPKDSARILSMDVAGYIVWATSDDNPLLSALEETGQPVVVSGGPAREGWGLVHLDDTTAAREVARLALHGRQHPAIIALPEAQHRTQALRYRPDPQAITFEVHRRRLAGYRAAVEEAGLNWADVPVLFLGRNDGDEAHEGVDKLLLHHPATDALICMSDQIALGALPVIRASGRAVPGAITVTGWDDGPVAKQHGLTTVRQSLRDQGVLCARMLFDDHLTAMEAPCSVIARSTTAG